MSIDIAHGAAQIFSRATPTSDLLFRANDFVLPASAICRIRCVKPYIDASGSLERSARIKPCQAPLISRVTGHLHI
jgi:hypothetical protein